ncbi:hypothetical protein [Roseibium litorale]|uniref:Uncharacterized protein n=1 Tax=Roseibium litorale TaxID=2803841 RepID=A0ABR9CH68_9HYPH|nr:hypothetical protein [Roseibium litorale]MBD8890190.1 hypothetical protein [Roseibium litorale]
MTSGLYHDGLDAVHAFDEQVANMTASDIFLSFIFGCSVNLPAPSLLDATVFHKIMPPILRAYEKNRHHLSGRHGFRPFRFAIDPMRHGANSTASPVNRVALSFLSGRAHMGTEIEGHKRYLQKISPNYKFISREYLENENEWRSLQEKLKKEQYNFDDWPNEEFAYSAQLLNSYLKLNHPACYSSELVVTEFPNFAIQYGKELAVTMFRNGDKNYRELVDFVEWVEIEEPKSRNQILNGFKSINQHSAVFDQLITPFINYIYSIWINQYINTHDLVFRRTNFDKSDMELLQNVSLSTKARIVGSSVSVSTEKNKRLLSDALPWDDLFALIANDKEWCANMKRINTCVSNRYGDSQLMDVLNRHAEYVVSIIGANVKIDENQQTEPTASFIFSRDMFGEFFAGASELGISFLGTALRAGISAVGQVAGAQGSVSPIVITSFANDAVSALEKKTKKRKKQHSERAEEIKKARMIARYGLQLRSQFSLGS